MDRRNIVEALNDLVSVCADGSVVCRAETRATQGAGMIEVPRSMEHQHDSLATQLRSVLALTGADALEFDAGPSFSYRQGELHHAVVCHDVHQTACELERAERRVLASYQLAITSEQMTPPLRTLLKRHCARMQTGLHTVYGLNADLSAPKSLALHTESHLTGPVGVARVSDRHVIPISLLRKLGAK